jgi:2-methylisocitrate lyase-like PEP mutase family enzyme
VSAIREGGRLRSTEEHTAYVAGLRAAADDAGVAIVINGRTDLFLCAGADNAGVLDEAIARMQSLVAAGADVLYPVKIQDDDELITAVAQALTVPVNITAHPAHTLERFESLGVGRVTFGPLLQSALTDHTEQLLAGWI